MYLMQTVSHQAPRKAVSAPMEPPAGKKQKSKWSLGSLFRRRSTKMEAAASESSSEDEKKQRGLLGRRRSARKRSERRQKGSNASSVVSRPEWSGSRAEWSGSANSLAGSSEGPSHSLSRRDRRELLKARVEATRRDSSSEEEPIGGSTGALARFHSDDSLSRRSRAARTERHLRRMEKDVPANHVWSATVIATTPSATPSPVVSPKMAHRGLPPPHHHQLLASPPSMRRSFCCEPPPGHYMTRPGPPYSAFLPFAPRQAPPPPPPRDPQRRTMVYDAKPVYRSRSDHQLPGSVERPPQASTPLFPSASQTHFKYLADRTPRSRRPIHVIPVHEPSPECVLPTPPAWLDEPPAPPRPSAPASPPLRRVSSIEVTLRPARPPSRTPPPPPVRRYSRQGSVSSVDEEHRATPSNPKNLEDALNELEQIYQSLQLGDEDLMDRAERRDLPTAFQMKSMSMDGDNDDFVLRRSFARAPPSRRSGVPDLVTDDMAYRRLKQAVPSSAPPSKDRTSGSYLLVSPALSPVPAIPMDPDEPNTTLDDMSYRAIKDANLSVNKVLDPQPPFGIPLAPAPAAPTSDYLHVKPSEKYRSTFRPRRTPDPVSDDLAFRNLRKDDNKMGVDLKRKRAVRSLSANLMNLMEQHDDIEKTQSLVNLPDTLQVLLEESPTVGTRPPPSWVERANLLDTSTETLTQSRANLRSLRNSFLASEPESRPLSLFVNSQSPIRETPSAEYVSPPLDEEKLEDLLSALAQEAHDTSERLGKELERLRDGTHSVEDLSLSPSLPGNNNRCAKLTAPTALNACTSYVPVYNHVESETNPPKAPLHEDVNNNNKFQPLTNDSLTADVEPRLSPPTELRITPPAEPPKMESPRSRTSSSQSELCTIQEDEVLVDVGRSHEVPVPIFVIEQIETEPLRWADEDSEDRVSLLDEEETNVLVDEEADDDLDDEEEGEVHFDEKEGDVLVDEEEDNAFVEEEPEEGEENEVPMPSQDAQDVEPVVIIEEHFSEEEEVDETIPLEVAEEAIDSTQVSEYAAEVDKEPERESASPVQPRIETESDDEEEIDCEAMLRKFNIPKLDLERVDENAEYDEADFEDLYNQSFGANTEPDEQALKEFEHLTSLICVETTTEVQMCEYVHLDSADDSLRSERSEYVPEAPEMPVIEEVYESSTRSVVDANGNRPLSEVEDDLDEVSRMSLTDHSTLLLPLLQMAKDGDRLSSTFQSNVVEKLDALIAEASFENNNCKVRPEDDDAPVTAATPGELLVEKLVSQRLEERHSIDYYVFLGAVLALVSIITAIANIAAR